MDNIFKDLVNAHEWVIVGSKKCGKTAQMRAEYRQHLFVEIDEISKKRGQTQKEFIDEFKVNSVAPLLFHNGKLFQQDKKNKKTKLVMRGKKLVSVHI